MEPWEALEVKRVSRFTKPLLVCPRCEFKFSLMYSRAASCIGCRLSVLGCQRVRCPKCDYEFPLERTHIASTRISARIIAQELAERLRKDHEAFGERFS